MAFGSRWPYISTCNPYQLHYLAIFIELKNSTHRHPTTDLVPLTISYIAVYVYMYISPWRALAWFVCFNQLVSACVISPNKRKKMHAQTCTNMHFLFLWQVSSFAAAFSPAVCTSITLKYPAPFRSVKIYLASFYCNWDVFPLSLPGSPTFLSHGNDIIIFMTIRISLLE